MCLPLHGLKLGLTCATGMRLFVHFLWLYVCLLKKLIQDERGERTNKLRNISNLIFTWAFLTPLRYGSEEL